MMPTLLRNGRGYWVVLLTSGERRVFDCFRDAWAHAKALARWDA